MENNVFEILKETFENPKIWNYYSGKNFKNFPLVSEQESKNFINEFIKLSGKSESEFNNLIQELGDRTVHVVSAFFIGHYIYQNTNLKSKIDREITKIKKDLNINSEVNFSFMWFLTCLFHDIGYKLEEQQPPKYENFEQLLNENSGAMPEICGIPKFYNTIYKNYFNFRLKEHCKNDHGITIAHIMYHKLCNIRKVAEKNPKEHQINLNWEKDLEKIFAFCSWNVLAHNIWFAEKGKTCDVRKYKVFEMEILIFDEKYKINPNEFPFFFLFCLVDTIEPYKKVLDLEMLKKIDLEFFEDKIIITDNFSCNCGKAILKQAKDLNKWLTYTNNETENKIMISLNQKPI